MTSTIGAIYRYPVKGLSAEKLDRVMLAPGAMPAAGPALCDRARLDGLRSAKPGMAAEAAFHHADARREIGAAANPVRRRKRRADDRRRGRVLLRGRIDRAGGCRDVAEFFTDFLGDAVDGPLRVVEAPGHAFADARRRPNAATGQYVSLINRASIAALEAAMGAPVDPIRFARISISTGRRPGSELDWIGAEITLGPVRLHVVSAITRCAATQVNPATAERDLDILAALDAQFRPHQHGRLRRGSGRWRDRRRRPLERAGLGVDIARRARPPHGCRLFDRADGEAGDEAVDEEVVEDGDRHARTGRPPSASPRSRRRRAPGRSAPPR